MVPLRGPRQPRFLAAHRLVGGLRAIGLDWDGSVVRQSERMELYEEAVSRGHAPCAEWFVRNELY